MGHAALCSCAGGSAGLEVCHAILVTKWHLSRWPEPSDRRTPAWCHAVCMLCPPASLPTAQHYTEERHRPFHPSFISVLNGLKYLSEARVRSRDSKGQRGEMNRLGWAVRRQGWQMRVEMEMNGAEISPQRGSNISPSLTTFTPTVPSFFCFHQFI